MVKIDKLVRDNIPNLIKLNGKNPEFYKLDSDKRYYDELCKKLIEETNEFVESGELEELADILEVVEAILIYKKVSISEIMEIKNSKATTNGKFEKRYFISHIEDIF